MNKTVRNKDSRKRKALALVLAALALVGFSFAAATQLQLKWNGNFQAGVVEVDADCQSGEITIAFNTPTYATTDVDKIPWTVDKLSVSDVDAGCNGMSYQVALSVDGEDWESSILSSGTITLADSAFTVDLPDTLDVQTISNIALTIYK